MSRTVHKLRTAPAAMPVLAGRWARMFLLGASATIVLLGVVFGYFGRAERSTRLTYDNVRRLSLLMSRQEVEALLGPPVLKRPVLEGERR